MVESRRDGRLILGRIALALGVLICIAEAGAAAFVWHGLQGIYSETETAALTGVCLGTAALVLSLPAIVTAALAFRRPEVAPAATNTAIAGLVLACIGAVLAVGLVVFSLLALVVNVGSVAS